MFVEHYKCIDGFARMYRNEGRGARYEVRHHLFLRVSVRGVELSGFDRGACFRLALFIQDCSISSKAALFKKILAGNHDYC
jgi:hypothetical protein